MFVHISKIIFTTLVVTFLFHVSHAKGYKKMHSGGGYSSYQGSYYQPSYQPYYYYGPQEQYCQSQPSCYSGYGGCSQQYNQQCGQNQYGCQPEASYSCQSMGCRPQRRCWSPQSLRFQNKQIVNQGSCCDSQSPCRPSYCYQQVSCGFPQSCSSSCNDDGCGSCMSGGSGCSPGYSSGCGMGCGSGCNSGGSSGFGMGCGSGCNSGGSSGCGMGCGPGCNSGSSSGCGMGCGSGCNSGGSSGCGMGCGSGCNSGGSSGCGMGCGSGCSSGSSSGCGNNGGCGLPNDYVLIPMLVPKQSLGANFLGTVGVESGCGKCASPCY